MDPEINRRLHELFDVHDKAIAALRAANRQLGTANQAMGNAIQAHDDAVEQAFAANRAALSLLARLQDGASQ